MPDGGQQTIELTAEMEAPPAGIDPAARLRPRAGYRREKHLQPVIGVADLWRLTGRNIEPTTDVDGPELADEIVTSFRIIGALERMVDATDARGISRAGQIRHCLVDERAHAMRLLRKWAEKAKAQAGAGEGAAK